MTKSMNITIWEREFDLPVDYDCYNGESITKEQKKTLKKFESHPEWIAQAKSVVEDFCREQVTKDEENNKKDNIFSYIKPDYLFVKRNREYQSVALMCDYRYDPEHGLAVVFSRDGKVTVGIQDIIL